MYSEQENFRENACSISNTINKNYKAFLLYETRSVCVSYFTYK